MLPHMVLEVALIDVQAGREDEFAAAYATAYPILMTIGDIGLRITLN